MIARPPVKKPVPSPAPSGPVVIKKIFLAPRSLLLALP